ncbi:MAG: EAL domain-containing protein [Alicyclobacillaceae bacterium]|nr:EAL domain-containing protein [Alicyclobacillaceae bacterium]
MRQLGLRIALDDGGTGTASLCALVHREPDVVKVDRSLIQGIATSSTTQRLLAHLVSFMGSPDSVIAEGVEEKDNLLAVREAGVWLSQEYYWSPPLVARQLETWHARMTELSSSILAHGQSGCFPDAVAGAVRRHPVSLGRESGQVWPHRTPRSKCDRAKPDRRLDGCNPYSNG